MKVIRRTRRLRRNSAIRSMIIVEPAFSYLEVIQRAKSNFNIPLVAYNVSGEYSILKSAVKNGIINEDAIMESLISMKRAGADIIISYFAKDIVKKLQVYN